MVRRRINLCTASSKQVVIDFSDMARRQPLHPQALDKIEELSQNEDRKVCKYGHHSQARVALYSRDYAWLVLPHHASLAKTRTTRQLTSFLNSSLGRSLLEPILGSEFHIRLSWSNAVPNLARRVLRMQYQNG